ncbi:hypothetical protein ILYODFUR_023513, partial [Ilyodon furcidens]
AESRFPVEQVSTQLLLIEAMEALLSSLSVSGFEILRVPLTERRTPLLTVYRSPV